MRIPIRNKLILSYVLISLLTAGLIYVFTYITSEQRVASLTREYQTQEMVHEVVDWFSVEQSWEGFADYFKSLHPPPAITDAVPNLESLGSDDKHFKQHGLITDEGYALLRYLQYQPGDLVPKAYWVDATPVTYDGDNIAWIIQPDVVGLSLTSEMKVFLDNILEVLLMAVVIAVFISLFMGIGLAKVTLSSVKSLHKATSAIANGDLKQQVPISGNDEITDLAQSFNKMSQQLSRADKQRRQLTADITHDLGTPLQVISGYVEMAQQDDFQLNSENIEIISDELGHIKRLLTDLSLLAETDARTLVLNLEKTEIVPLLERVIRLFKKGCNEKQISLHLHSKERLPTLELDTERMVQVLSNLISNAMRYTTEGGCIRIETECDDKNLLIKVIDDGSGIHRNDLPFLFDRFYQADRCRNDMSGKMGLGLSISKGLIEMQHGRIYAESDGVQGSCFVLTFPVARS